MMINSTKEALVLNQFRAAENVFQSLNNFFALTRKDVSGLSFLSSLSTSQEVARHICLPTVACTAVLFIYHSKIIGDETGEITVGDFYKTMLPLHKVEPTNLPIPYDMGWRVVDSYANTYHHAVAAFLSVFGVRTYSLLDFPGVGWLLEKIKDQKAFLALSLDSSFILEETLDQENIEFLKKVYPGFGAGRGRHMVCVCGFDDNNVLVADPFQVLRKGESPKIKTLSHGAVDKYFQYQFPGPTQALVFSFDEIDFPKVNAKNIFVPGYVKKEMEFLFEKLKIEKKL